MNKNFIRFLFLILVLWLPVLVKAAIYKKTDASGTVYFSDTLMPNATLIQLKPINTYTTPLPADKNSSAKAENKQEGTISRYKVFSITHPIDQQTFYNQRDISAKLNLEPALHAEDKIVWLLDGKSSVSSVDMQRVFQSLDRGEHRLQAQILNANKQVLMSTATVTFYVHLSTVEQVSTSMSRPSDSGVHK